MTGPSSAARIRRARPAEAELLAELALRSKAHWPYPPEFIEACRPALTLRPEYIAEWPVFVVEDGGGVRGFYGLERDEGGIGLAFLFVDPAAIGRGYGRRLLSHAARAARRLGAEVLLVESDPYAEGFYLSSGAVRSGERASSVDPSRLLPLLRIDLARPPEVAVSRRRSR
jgi:GNAT superfamily N-acetyltransferase